jgi:5-methylcytosine-specific restriction endonuclease McrA
MLTPMRTCARRLDTWAQCGIIGDTSPTYLPVFLLPVIGSARAIRWQVGDAPWQQARIEPFALRSVTMSYPTLSVWLTKHKATECYYCRVPLENVQIDRDHKLPLSRGGKDKDNIVLTCHSCNCAKRAMTASEFKSALLHNWRYQYWVPERLKRIPPYWRTFPPGFDLIAFLGDQWFEDLNGSEVERTEQCRMF